MHPPQLVTAEVRLPAALAQEFTGLSPEQREAARHQGNLVVLAGPGAGKTRTLVARIGYLLATTSRHRSVAAITFTDTAAAEVGARLRRLGMPGGRRVASNTIHGFCLRHILRPYARFADVPFPDQVTVSDDKQLKAWWEQAALDSGLGQVVDRDITSLNKQRRQLAAGADPQDFDPRYLKTIARYQALLDEHQALDFDAMTERALAVLRSSAEVRRMLAARFPHLVVDEYQDLGPVLHAIVLTLLDSGVQVTAVGDPDQMMFTFLGADALHLEELRQRADFTSRVLSVNFRSGGRLIEAGLRVLGASHGYRPAPDREELGLITHRRVEGDLDAHAAHAVAIAQERISAGTPPEEVAVLYPGKGPLLTQLKAELGRTQTAYDAEKARKIPSGPLADFISDCTSRYLSGPLPGTSARVAGTAQARTIMDLATLWHRRLIDAGLAIEEDTPRSLARRLAALLDTTPEPAPSDPASAFFEGVCALLELDALAHASSDERDHTALAECRAACANGLTLAELAGGRSPGRITLTTYHSSKGREFDVVILPGLINKHVPYYGQYGLTEGELHIARRNFYVALTRARHEVVLLTGNFFTDAWNVPRRTSPSIFALDVLTDSPAPDHQ
ncbi:ATP-dependent helicase [Streptomyces sp. SID14515]|uniref:UvrD-helicase domain-containing protein n=1 Tax=Streptomyces sp. SID14515 TaxID=2706074 RepID=UPI0013CCF865|nr:ATP-dependent helicase [Streptomyces sp. SID14515]NEB39513.1 ATP-dependent helicase [Streptomyces sp. SID14515]